MIQCWKGSEAAKFTGKKYHLLWKNQITISIKKMMNESVHFTFVMLTVGKEIPIKYPNTIPMTVEIIILILSFDFLVSTLQS